MSIYQALQLNAAGSKALIKNSKDKREKWKWIFVYLLKNFLTVAFCFAFVSIYSVLFGSENSIAGVVILLSLLVLRFADFGIRTKHGVGVVFITFAILTLGPHMANQTGIIGAFLINSACILLLMILNCHNVIMSNHSTFVLSYLLLQGYDVTGTAFQARAVSMAAGAAVCAFIFYRNHRKMQYKRTFADLFREFDIHAFRTKWYLRMTFGITSSLLLAALLKMPRPMWVGVSVMSVLLPFTQDLLYRVKRRAPFGAIGCAVFAVIYLLLPESMYPFIGLLGGIGVGFSASYSWQTIFNTFGALAVAVSLFGLHGAIAYRILAIAFGSLYGGLFHYLVNIWPHLKNAFGRDQDLLEG